MKNAFCWLALMVALSSTMIAQVTGDAGHVEVYVTPFYNSKGPQVEVGPFSKGLAAKTEPEFVATITRMKQAWNELRFPETYVAAIRLYDLGFRDESVYWFYSAQYRGRLFAALIDREKMGTMGSPGFEFVQAASAFQQLVGPYLNGYAFRDIDRLVQIVARVQKENSTAPNIERIYPGIAFKPRAEWAATNQSLNEGLTAFLAHLQEQKADLKKTRNENGTEAKFSKLGSKELPK